ncbi:hypothetical protein ACTHGU_03415 [Chitinophagaceae bacterium MMS25-I14]
MRFCLIALLFLLISVSSFAQSAYDTTGLTKRQKKNIFHGYYPPKVLLLILPTGGTRRTYLQKTHDTKRLAFLQEDIQTMQQKMIQDFKDNFTYCPVYFFADTNSALIKEQKFNGALLDDKLQPVAGSVIPAGDTNYIIGYFGVAGVESTAADTAAPDPRKPTEEIYLKSQNGQSGLGLHIMTYRFAHIVSPQPFGVRQTTFFSLNRAEKRRMSIYNFKSEHFEISYTASAALYNATLLHFYGPMRTQ